MKTPSPEPSALPPEEALAELTPAEAVAPQAEAPAITVTLPLLDPKQLDTCIHCGLCLPSCPTYIASGSEAESPRGRLYLMRQWQEGDRVNDAQLSLHLDNCLGCLNCQTVCPSGVPYGDLLFSARAALAKRKPMTPSRRFKRWAMAHLLPSPFLLNLMGLGIRLYQGLGIQKLVRSLGLLRPFPKLASAEALTPTLDAPLPPLTPGMRFGPKDGERVALFTGCVMDTIYRRIHWATIRVLVAQGYQVVIPSQTCCGALPDHAGETDIAADLARKNVNMLLDDDPVWVVLNSAGCGAALKEYGHHLGTDEAKALSNRVIDIMALLAQKPLAPMTRALDKTVTYHAACHLYHAQKVRTEPLGVLQQIPKLELVPLMEFEACCGSAGIYNVEHPEMSGDILDRKMGHLANTQAEIVVTGNPGCLLQLETGVRQTGLSMEVRHPIELLAEAYGDVDLQARRR
jgi:glycolate oxidase iron-sulfur subunit